MSIFLRFYPHSCLRKCSSNLLQLNTRKIRTTTSLQNLRLRKIFNSSERNYLKKDEISSGYQLIYRAPMELYMSAAKNVSSVTVSIVTILASYKLATDANYFSIPIEMDFVGLVSHDTDIWWYVAGFVAINLAIRLFVAKYPLRIYKTADKYLAVYDSQLPFRSRKHIFNRGDVSEVHHFFNPWSGVTFRLGNRTSLLLIDYFKTPSEFHEMVGVK